MGFPPRGGVKPTSSRMFCVTDWIKAALLSSDRSHSFNERVSFSSCWNVCSDGWADSFSSWEMCWEGFRFWSSFSCEADWEVCGEFDFSCWEGLEDSSWRSDCGGSDSSYGSGPASGICIMVYSGSCFSRRAGSMMSALFGVAGAEWNSFWGAMCSENSLERLKFPKRCTMIGAFGLVVDSSVSSSWNKNSVSSVLLFSLIILTAETREVGFEEPAVNDAACVDWGTGWFVGSSTSSSSSSDSVILVWLLYLLLLRILRWGWKGSFSRAASSVCAARSGCRWVGCGGFVWLVGSGAFWVTDWIGGRSISTVTSCCGGFAGGSRWFSVCSFEDAVDREVERSLRLYRLFDLYELLMSRSLRFLGWARSKLGVIDSAACWAWPEVVWLWIAGAGRFCSGSGWGVSGGRVFEIISSSSSYLIWRLIVDATWRRQVMRDIR